MICLITRTYMTFIYFCDSKWNNKKVPLWNSIIAQKICLFKKLSRQIFFIHSYWFYSIWKENSDDYKNATTTPRYHDDNSGYSNWYERLFSFYIRQSPLWDCLLDKNRSNAKPKSILFMKNFSKTYVLSKKILA